MNIIKNMSPYAAVNYIIKGIGYEEYYKEYILTHRINGTEAYDKIEEFKEMAKQFDTIDNWLEYINNNNISMNNPKNTVLVENIKASKNSYPQDNDNAVHFHTMHSCKGLEYKVVFIMDVVEGIIPYNKAVLDYEIEEERRLMYVAMTRAKEKLILTGSRKMILTGMQKEKSQRIDRLSGRSYFDWNQKGTSDGSKTGLSIENLYSGRSFVAAGRK